VQIGSEKKIRKEGDEVIIPRKTIHRLEGANADAIILEISTGDFDEKDIIRLEDDYNRT
jgi:mannose-1-phosphate guanylyltransferase